MRVSLSLMVSMILGGAFYAKVKGVAPTVFLGASPPDPSLLCPPFNLPWPRRCSSAYMNSYDNILLFFTGGGLMTIIIITIIIIIIILIMIIIIIIIIA